MSTVVNTTYLVGRVGTKPERADNRVKFRLAVDSGYDKDAKEGITTWYDATAWDDMADAIAEQFSVGNRVWVGGQTSIWKGSTGDRDQIKVRDAGKAPRVEFNTGEEGVTLDEDW